MVKSDLFKPATNEQAFLKAGITGFQGSGKTYTSYLIAKGIIDHLSPPKGQRIPLFHLDTETGSSFLVKDAKRDGIEYLTAKSRVFKNLLLAIDEAERIGAVLLIDSITHFWVQLARDLRDEMKRKAMGAGDWVQLSDIWAQFSDRFVNSSVHIIMCARAGWEYDESMDDDGNKVLSKLRTKMKGQAEMGFEPSLLVEMAQESRAGERARGAKRLKGGQLWDYVAYIQKDRSRTVEGRRFVNPTFEQFRPVVEFLNLGGQQLSVDTSRNSRDLFRRDQADQTL